MTLTPDLPQREVTPEERRRAGRFFWLIVLLFPVVVGTMVAYLSVKGRQVRDYGQAVIQQAVKLSPPLNGNVPCSSITRIPAPPSIKTCTFEQLGNGSITVTIETTGGQKYQFQNDG